MLKKDFGVSDGVKIQKFLDKVRSYCKCFCSRKVHGAKRIGYIILCYWAHIFIYVVVDGIVNVGVLLSIL